MILCYGQDLVSRILTPIHIWRCTGDAEQAKVFSDKYSAVNDFYLKIRKIICDISIPRRLELFHNLEMGIDGNIIIKHYPESLEGIINSYVDR
jgi:dipeptidyl-peptidase-3